MICIIPVDVIYILRYLDLRLHPAIAHWCRKMLNKKTTIKYSSKCTSETKRELSLQTCIFKKNLHPVEMPRKNQKHYNITPLPNVLQGMEKAYIPRIILSCNGDLNMLIKILHN